MSDEKFIIQELTAAVEATFSIECTLCGNGSTSLSISSKHDAAKDFYDNGWRTDESDTMCRECAEAR